MLAAAMTPTLPSRFEQPTAPTRPEDGGRWWKLTAFSGHPLASDRASIAGMEQGDEAEPPEPCCTGMAPPFFVRPDRKEVYWNISTPFVLEVRLPPFNPYGSCLEHGRAQLRYGYRDAVAGGMQLINTVTPGGAMVSTMTLKRPTTMDLFAEFMDSNNNVLCPHLAAYRTVHVVNGLPASAIEAVDQCNQLDTPEQTVHCIAQLGSAPFAEILGARLRCCKHCSTV